VQWLNPVSQQASHVGTPEKARSTAAQLVSAVEAR
jgi:hypothetical protein